MIACPRCRMEQTAPHRTSDDCIAELRAELTRREAASESNPYSRRFWTIIVKLDGIEMPLPEAANKLDVTASALYNRIYRKARNYITPDIRAIGADVRGNSPSGKRKAKQC